MTFLEPFFATCVTKFTRVFVGFLRGTGNTMVIAFVNQNGFLARKGSIF